MVQSRNEVGLCGHEENHRVFLAKMRLNLGGVGRNGADVCNVVASF